MYQSGSCKSFAAISVKLPIERMWFKSSAEGPSVATGTMPPWKNGWLSALSGTTSDGVKSGCNTLFSLFNTSATVASRGFGLGLPMLDRSILMPVLLTPLASRPAQPSVARGAGKDATRLRPADGRMASSSADFLNGASTVVSPLSAEPFVGRGLEIGSREMSTLRFCGPPTAALQQSPLGADALAPAPRPTTTAAPAPPSFTSCGDVVHWSCLTEGSSPELPSPSLP
mmetsp:Transcript_4103/g.10398  ORF Transcript_4103/g.10398 Transcript_4103/m.10398 type:complete len:228 (+) Transcript_4103:528-1211(+)